MGADGAPFWRGIGFCAAGEKVALWMGGCGVGCPGVMDW